MTEEIMAGRVRAAIESFTVPVYPIGVGRYVAPPKTTAHSRLRRVLAYGTMVACVLAVAAVSAAVAVPTVVPDRIVRALARAGIHLKTADFVAVDTRQVSLAQARAAANFPVLMPSNVRLVRTLLAVDAVHHRTFVDVVLQDGRGGQIQITESRADPRHPPAHSPILRIDNDGSVHKLPPPIVWNIGETQLMIGPYDRGSRAFAERLRRATFISGRSSR